MATPTIREVVSAGASGGSATVNTGAATAVDDVLVCFHGGDWDSAANFTAPTGTSGTWTLQATGDNGTNSAHLKVWTRPVTTGGAQTVTAGQPTGDEVINTTFVLTGADTTTPADGAAGSNGAASTSQVAPSVSPATSDALLLCGTQTADGFGTYTPPTGMTERSDLDAGGWSNQSTASLVLAASGATGTKTFTGTASSAWATASIAIQGAGAGAPAASLPISRRAHRGLILR